MAALQQRVDKKIQLAEAASAGTVMRVDPDQVDGLARFFKDRAAELRARERDVRELVTIEPPGTDPVSKAATKEYRKVAAGDAQAYLDNYLKLADVFEQTAENLRSMARQTRSDDQDAEGNFRKA